MKGPGSAVMTAPEQSLTPSHCLLCRLCIAASLRYLIYPSHILSHLSLARSWLPGGSVYWTALKPNVPVLQAGEGGWGGGGVGEWQPIDL